MIETTRKISQHPGPKGMTLLKDMWEFARNPLDFCPRCAQEYGDIVDLSFGSSRFYLFNHPRLIEEVLRKHQQSVKDYSYRALEPVLGNGLVLSHGNVWKHNRRLIQSAFSSDRLNRYAEQVVLETDLMLENWQVGESRDIHREMSLLTLKVIIRAMFGVDGTQIAEEIRKALNTILLQYFHQTEVLFLLPNWLPTPENLRTSRAINKLNKIVDRIIEQRRQEPHTEDLLSTLLSATDEAGKPLGDRHIRDEVITLLIAGHETTANALTWTFMLLAQHPQVEAKIAAESRAVSDCKASRRHRPLNRDDLSQLPYTEMVLKESMRIYPPAWILGRELTSDCEIDGYNFTRGSVIYLSQWVVHRDRRFFADPEQFISERWNDLEQHLPNCAYFPFGAGARVCIGKTFSMMETTLILAKIVRQFSLTLETSYSTELLPSLTLRPKSGLKMKIASRK